MITAAPLAQTVKPSSDSLLKKTDMSEAYQYDDGCRLLIFRHADEECQALMAHYSGIRFNQVRLTFLPLRALQDVPDREEIEMTFNISGMAFDLTRHGFAHPSWWRMVPPSGITHRCHTEGFGRAWRAIRTRTGFRLQGAHYIDGMTKLTVALKPIFHARRFARGVTPLRNP
jgi:hypothetical protein